MFCKYCGAEVIDESRFCSKCGKELVEEQKKTSNDEKININVNLEDIKSAYKEKPYNGFCIAGFICSLFPWVFSSGAILLSIIGLIISKIGLKDVKAKDERGEVFAVIGIVFSSVTLIVAILAFSAGVSLLAFLFGSSY